MLYFTVHNTSGGFHGHQLKDLIGGITVGKLFDFTYAHTRYPYLDFFAVWAGERFVHKLPATIERVHAAGPFWHGMGYQDAVDMFAPLRERFAARDGLLVLENALRIFPHQARQWHAEGRVKRDVFEEVAAELTDKFARTHAALPTTYDPAKFNVAIHIAHGVDADPRRYPEHFIGSNAVRYIFPMDYWDELLERLRAALKPYDYLLHIYTEALNSEEIVERFGKRDRVVLHLGSNRHDKNDDLAHHIFLHFVRADILVACNSSFSAMASYFRNDKLTIYHPHHHLADLPPDRFVATRADGSFDQRAVVNYCRRRRRQPLMSRVRSLLGDRWKWREHVGAGGQVDEPSAKTTAPPPARR